MSKWTDNAICRKDLKADEPLKSWWAAADVKSNRAVFHKRMDEELTRIQNHPRFGGSRKIHDDGGLK